MNSKNILQFSLNKNKKWEQISKLIKKFKIIYIIGHSNPDGDSLGSQFALRNVIKINFGHKKIYTPLKGSVANEKWTFKITNNDPEPDQLALEKDLIILVDVNNPKRTDFPQIAQAKNLIIIDHHIVNPHHLPSHLTAWIEAKASSVCEMIARFLMWQKWQMNQEISNALLTGIITDTGNLKFNSTKAETFFIVGWLILKKGQLVEIHNRINHLSKNDVAVFQFFQKNYVDAKTFKYFAFKPKDKANLPWVNETYQFKRYLHFLKNIDETKICATFLQFKEGGEIHCSLRSKKIDVNSIAQRFGGGGHRLASGIKLKSWLRVEALIDEIKGTLNHV